MAIKTGLMPSQPPDDQIQRARRTVARYAENPDELRELLGMLGLLPGQKVRDRERKR